MAIQRPNERKRRTREHAIADQSINHVERQIIDEGHVALRTVSDYRIDLLLSTFDEEGYVEPGYVSIQVKASEHLAQSKGEYYHDLDIRDYNLWKDEEFPICLVLYDASTCKAYYLELTQLFRGLNWRGPRKGAKTVRVLVPASNVFDCEAVSQLRRMKSRTRGSIFEEGSS